MTSNTSRIGRRGVVLAALSAVGGLAVGLPRVAVAGVPTASISRWTPHGLSHETLHIYMISL